MASPFAVVGPLPSARCLAGLTKGFLLLCCVSLSCTANADDLPVIGVSARATEAQSGVSFPARVDTGAASCSLHVEKYRIKDAADSMHANVGKPVRLLIRDEQGGSHWIESEVADVASVKNPNSPEEQHRYKVWLKLSVEGEEGRVKVSIADRGHMRFPMLLGRNFLAGRFVIDPSRDGV